jgi:hypothetical protein
LKEWVIYEEIQNILYVFRKYVICQINNASMKVITKKTILLIYIFILLSVSGCFQDSNKETFVIDPFKSGDVPDDIQNQIAGAGCAYFQLNNEEFIYMSNGLIKINGIYEVLQEKQIDSPDFSKQVYENSRWIIYIDMDTSNNENTQETGTLTLRSKGKDGVTTVKINRFCGT